MLSIKTNLAFSQPILLNFLLQNENTKLFLKIVNLRKKVYNFHMYNVHVMYYYHINVFNAFKMALNFEICGANIALVFEFQICNGRRSVIRICRKGKFPLTTNRFIRMN